MRAKLIASVFLSVITMLATIGGAQAKSARWNADYFSNRPVVTQDGRQLRFYDDLIKDKIVVVSFIFTTCQDLCPLTTARLRLIQQKLGDRVGRDIFFVSMTVDPENDTPAKLKQFADAFSVAPGWTFATGRPEDVRAINAALGDRSRTKSEHRNEVVLGNDRTGEWQRSSTFDDLDRLVMEIEAMDPAWRAEKRPAYSGQTVTTDDATLSAAMRPGQDLFKRACSACHTVGVGDRVGPDLLGVTDRRDHDWLRRFIRDPAAMRAAGDPQTLELDARFPGARMPRFGLAEGDVDDVISYLKSQTDLITASRQSPEGMAHEHEVGAAHDDASHAHGQHAGHGGHHHGEPEAASHVQTLDEDEARVIP